MFLFQSRGTAGIGKIFGPVTLVWFAVLAVLGIMQIFRYPEVLAAINPLHGVDFFLRNGWHGFLILGSVFLVITGGEALYADMGHFGMRPIRLAWFTIVLPALLLNYFGQGALLLENPAAAENPFYRLVPSWGLYPMVVLATAAAVIASQAVITGAFSLAMQAVQLGFSPASEDHPHVDQRVWTDIHSRDQLGPDVRMYRHRDRLPQFQQPGRGLRNSGDIDDGDHDDPVLRRRAASAGVGAG